MPAVRTSELISGMTFLGVRHEKTKTTIDLLAWPNKYKDKFVQALEEKFTAKNSGSANLSSSLVYANDRDHDEVKQYFNANITKITDALALKCITTNEDLLIVDHTTTDKETGDTKTESYVYFGGMTKTLVYVACWMVVPVDYKAKPKLLFWFLNTYYAQQLESLEDTEVQIDLLEKCTDLSSSPEY